MRQVELKEVVANYAPKKPLNKILRISEEELRESINRMVAKLKELADSKGKKLDHYYSAFPFGITVRGLNPELFEFPEIVEMFGLDNRVLDEQAKLVAKNLISYATVGAKQALTDRTPEGMLAYFGDEGPQDKPICVVDMLYKHNLGESVPLDQYVAATHLLDEKVKFLCSEAQKGIVKKVLGKGE